MSINPDNLLSDVAKLRAILASRAAVLAVLRTELAGTELAVARAWSEDEADLHGQRARRCRPLVGALERLVKSSERVRTYGIVVPVLEPGQGGKANGAAIWPPSSSACRIGARHSHPSRNVASDTAVNATRGKSQWQYRPGNLGHCLGNGAPARPLKFPLGSDRAHWTRHKDRMMFVRGCYEDR
jgi:hypothetical protein